MTAKDYKVTFGYGATDGVYYYVPTPTHPKTSKWVGNFHRGNDRKTPIGTPVVIAGVSIGRTGATGKVSGPHLHTQAGTDLACQKTVDPTPYDFKPGKVVGLRKVNLGQWGKYVTMQVGPSNFVTYAHLDSVSAVLGQVIKPVTHIETVRPGTWNVRTKPDLSGTVIGIVKGGEKYNTVIVAGGWRKITFNGKTGYVGPKAW